MPVRYTLPALFLALLLVAVTPSPSLADSASAPRADSAFDLINAVNALRVSYGLPAYSISPTLMYTAQNQADFMAANGIVTHSGPGGISLTDRLLAAGYPLAGDLSLGGFRAENITSGGEGASAQWAVDQWMGDAPHQNTMLSPNLTEIGAGVAVAGGRVYYVIDAARPTTSGAPQAANTPVAGGSAVPAGEAPVVSSVVIISTPNADGQVIHEVLSGQTLWQIAISYDVKIDDIKRLNNLAGNDIYPGNKLVIKTEAPAVAESPTAAPTFTPSPPPPATSTPLPSPTPLAATATLAPAASPAPANGTIMGIAIGILALALLGGGMFTWLGSGKKPEA